MTPVKRILLGLIAAFTIVSFASGAENHTEALSALAALKTDVAKPSLSAEELRGFTKVITASKVDEQSGELIKACLDLVSTYDKVQGPLFVARGEWDKGKGNKNIPDDIHWAIYNVMQYIFDEFYTAENIARYGGLLNGFVFGSSAHFPGPAALPEDPENLYEAKVSCWSPVNITYEEPHLAGPRRPTGAYVAPGTVVTVVVPEELLDKGYKIRVGAHSWDNTKKRRVTRLARVSHVYDVNTVTNTLMHPLGGGIYIEVPKGADEGVVAISIKGALRSPYFCATSFQKTTNKEWVEIESKRKAPWADFHTDKFMMQVPTMWVTRLADPEKLMSDWDLACDAQNELFGQPLVKARHTHYLQVDLQNRGRAFYPGYPTCNDRYDPNKEAEYEGYANHYLVRGPQTAPNYVFHEQGHAFNCPKYPGERESVVNLPHVAVWNRKFGYTMNEAFSASRSHLSDDVHTMDNTAVTWMMNLHFVNEEPMANYEKQYQWKGHAKYVDIANMFGWDVLSKYWGAFNDEVNAGTFKGKHAYSNDEITLRKCQAAGVDLRPLVRFWGIHEDDYDALSKEVSAIQVRPSAKIYDRLVHYKSLIPKDNAAFREFALMWWGKEPSSEGFTTERNHAERWKDYDEKEAKRVGKVVQDIIDRYFPDGRPKDA